MTTSASRALLLRHHEAPRGHLGLEGLLDVSGNGQGAGLGAVAPHDLSVLSDQELKKQVRKAQQRRHSEASEQRAAAASKTIIEMR